MDHNSDDESLELGSKSWNRIFTAAIKTGYREGVEEGSSTVLQSDFDIGYVDGFKIAFILGKYKAIANLYLKDTQHPQEIIDILNTTKRGACYICKLEQNSENLDPQAIELHKEHTTKILNKLYDYFLPLLKNKNIDLAKMNIEKNI
ncbi:hypothetical protein HCN44_000648 [Aphidius gifuensis]|uniref:Essential protein Yae1 N-terminal domain-containing protein n=1 Tax=Aphidius gifuensis TaxID=684658 RepID=A0A835CR35_APHGI|nr:uncharacterized protein LOC122854786 [Aphidius gifuensis]KAF7990843.1 hypothetical protein HCN44_000648 [Aphidius gifuensis]